MYDSSHNYRICLDPLPPEDGGGWVAYAPDLPGCMSDGETREEALHNVDRAIEEWIDEATALGRHIPAPEPHRRLASV